MTICSTHLYSIPISENCFAHHKSDINLMNQSIMGALWWLACQETFLFIDMAKHNSPVIRPSLKMLHWLIITNALRSGWSQRSQSQRAYLWGNQGKPNLDTQNKGCIKLERVAIDELHRDIFPSHMAIPKLECRWYRREDSQSDHPDIADIWSSGKLTCGHKISRLVSSI